MTTLDDRLLGEKTHYYCSSSEDEREEDRSEGSEGSGSGGASGASASAAAPAAPEPPPFEPVYPGKLKGSTTNTGPKGVIKDWQRFKQLENERREEQEAEKLALIKKLSLTCAPDSKTDKDKDRKEKKSKGKSKKDRNKNKGKDDDDDEIDKMLEEDDEFFETYVKQRMQEMIARYEQLPSFGALVSLNSGPAFVKAIDEEHKEVTVFIHLYEPDKRACYTLNECLVSLANDYPRGFKFCKLDVRVVNMTEYFQAQGVPALLIYRGGNLVGNFVRLGDEFETDEFSPADVCKFLVEHGFLPDHSLVPKIIRTASLKDDD